MRVGGHAVNYHQSYHTLHHPYQVVSRVDRPHHVQPLIIIIINQHHHTPHHPHQVVRRVDRPRPLKLSAANRLSALELSSVEDVVVLMENVCR